MLNSNSAASRARFGDFQSALNPQQELVNSTDSTQNGIMVSKPMKESLDIKSPKLVRITL